MKKGILYDYMQLTIVILWLSILILIGLEDVLVVEWKLFLMIISFYFFQESILRDYE